MRRHMQGGVLGFWVSFALLALIVGACGGGEATATPKPQPTSAPTVTPAPPGPGVPTATPTRAPQPQATSAPTAAPGPSPGPQATSAPTVAPTPSPRPATTPVPATPAGPEPKYGGTIKTRMRADVVTWDVLHVQDWPNTYVINPMQNWLVVQDPYDASRIVPDLAQSWTAGQDGKTYTFVLRRDVKWHDGKPFTSKDVLYNLELAGNPTDPRRNYLQPRMGLIATKEAPDEFTVKLTTSRVSALFLENLGLSQMTLYASQQPKETFSATGNVIGTGPFKFVSYTKGSGSAVTRNPEYFRKDGAGRALPYLDGIQYFIMSPETALAAFRTGQTNTTNGSHDNDWAFPQRAAMKRAFPDAIFNFVTTSRIDLYLNNKPPYNDQRVRSALNLAADRQVMNNVQAEGEGEPLASPMLPASRGGIWGLPTEEMKAMPGFRADKKAEDIARAKQLLKDAGIDPASFKVDMVGTDFYRVAAETMEGILRQNLGIAVSLRILTTIANTEALASGSFDMTPNSASILTDEAEGLIGTFVGTGRGRNFGKWSDARIDALLDQQDATLDPVKRKEILFELQRLFIDRAYSIPLIWNPGLAIIKKEVKNTPHLITSFHPAAFYNWERVWIER